MIRNVVTANIGTGFPNSPRHQAGLWTRYNGPRSKFGVGLGSKYVSARANTLAALPVTALLGWLALRSAALCGRSAAHKFCPNL